MSWFSSAAHSISRVFDKAVKSPSNLFDGHSALVRALGGDPVAVGQVFDNTAIQHQSLATQVNNSEKSVAGVGNNVVAFHRDIVGFVSDGAHWVVHQVVTIWHSVWGAISHVWKQTGIKKGWNKLGDNIHTTVQKWGGERRVMAWAVVIVVVVVVVIIEVVTFGAATPAIGPGGWAIVMALLSYGVQQGLTPDSPKLGALREFAPSLTNDNTYNSNSSTNSSSGGEQSGSFLDSLANALGNLPPIALAGVAVAGAAGLYFLLRKR